MFIALFFLNSAFAATESMPSMPIAHEKNSFVVGKDGEAHGASALLHSSGFGEHASAVEAQNRMMVEGKVSGQHAGMQMDDPAPATSHGNSTFVVILEDSPKRARVGKNEVLFQLKDKASGKLLVHAKPKVQVFMTSMDMGSSSPKVTEDNPDVYRVSAVFSMEGEWAIRVSLPSGESEVLPYRVSQ